MKKTSFLYLSLAAIVAGSFSSCQEEDFGFDYETVKLSAYERDFVKEFGEPAPNHPWGFDMANATFNYLLTGELPEVASSGTRAVIKQDQNLPGNIHITDIYAKPANITENEHKEVYAWFTNHKVEWTNTPTWYQGESTRQTSDGKAHIIDASNPNYGTLKKHSENPLTGDYIINNNVSAFNGWIQHVNSAKNNEDADEKDENGNSLVGGADFLRFWTLGTTNSWEHLNDFNSGNGYGYGNQSGQNAIFVSNANFNVVTYGSSQASSLPHDKYYIVYLKGDDYEGWYLGLDFEADKPDANGNERVKANGICNDWIIKISDVGTPTYNPARIMCEDLGGTFDTDFNDIVYDVELEVNGGNKINKVVLTLQAAGGTLPIKVTYKDVVVWEEVHAAFGVPVSTPVNVGAPGGVTKDPLVKDLLSGVGNINYFNMDDINVYVKRTEKAEWVNITRLDRESLIPCRICVPNTVIWPAELQSITWAYPGFVDWVKDPSKKFWEGTINRQYLYGTYTSNVAPPSSGVNSGTQNTPSNNAVPGGAGGQDITTLAANGQFSAMRTIPENAQSVTLTFTFENNINGVIGVKDQYNNLVQSSSVPVGYSTSSPLSVIITGELVSAARTGNLFFVNYGNIGDIKRIEYSVRN